MENDDYPYGTVLEENGEPRQRFKVAGEWELLGTKMLLLSLLSPSGTEVSFDLSLPRDKVCKHYKLIARPLSTPAAPIQS